MVCTVATELEACSNSENYTCRSFVLKANFESLPRPSMFEFFWVATLEAQKDDWRSGGRRVGAPRERTLY